MMGIRHRSLTDVLPEISWETVAPPYLNYDYFNGIESYPFRHRASMFDMVNAWWLAEASVLAYAEESFARPIFVKANLSEVRFFTGKGTQCYVANNDDFVITVFRGTEIRQRTGACDIRNVIEDIGTDADIMLVDSKQGGLVHRGFMGGLDAVWEKEGLLDYIKSKDNSKRTIWFTGHSLGAALATLAADRYGNVSGLYTFGSPRPGDTAFANDFYVKTYRFVNNNDVVARVPPSGLYRHVGDLKYIDSEGLIHDHTSSWRKMTDSVRGQVAHIFNSLGQIRSGFAGLLPDDVIDHVPTLYATHIWNNLR
jgi:triacylglycerol lipase